MKDILIRPIVTEKFTRLGEDKPGRNKQYAFEVNLDANKIEIKNAIEAKYGVSVQKVRTLIKRTERITRYTRKRIIEGKQGRIKRAVITLAPGNEIDFFANV